MVVTFPDPDKAMLQLAVAQKTSTSEKKRVYCASYVSFMHAWKNLPPMLSSHFLEKDKGAQAAVLQGKCTSQGPWAVRSREKEGKIN